MKKYIAFPFWIMLLFQCNHLAAQNGYRLEFEDVVTLSVDTFPGLPIPANATWSKSYTVPANMVLKINSGMLRNSPNLNGGTFSNMVVYLDINGNVVGSALQGTETDGTNNFYYYQDDRMKPYIEFTNEAPLWVSSGKTINLTFKSLTANVTVSLANGWVSGVLFRKVPIP